MLGFTRRFRKACILLALSSLLAAAPVATAKKPADTGERCGTEDPPVGYEYEIGFGSGRDEAEARANAQDDAEQRLLGKVCAGLPQARCDGIHRTIRPWKSDAYDKRARSACAVVAFPRSALERMEAEARQLEADLIAMASEVAAHGDGALHHQAPVWKNGCAASSIGEYLQTVLDGQLGRSGAALVRDERQARDHDVPRFRLELAPGPAGVTVAGYLHRTGVVGEIAVPGPDFALDLFGVEADEGGDCLDDPALGLARGHRTGAGDLTLQVDLPSGRNLFDDGEHIEPTLAVDRPARVKVFSVLPDGRAWLVWPASGDGMIRDGSASIGDGMVLATDLGDERIVAVAVADGESFGSADRWSGFCRVEGAFSTDLFPSSAAIGTATYSVRKGSSTVEDAERKRYRDALEAAPVCGD